MKNLSENKAILGARRLEGPLENGLLADGNFIGIKIWIYFELKSERRDFLLHISGPLAAAHEMERAGAIFFVGAGGSLILCHLVLVVMLGFAGMAPAGSRGKAGEHEHEPKKHHQDFAKHASWHRFIVEPKQRKVNTGFFELFPEDTEGTARLFRKNCA